jgi:hypothetical protein
MELQKAPGKIGIPIILSHPLSFNHAPGSAVTFAVTATGSQPLAYRWQFNGTNLAEGGRIIGATNRTLTISNVSTNDAGSYTVVVTNSFGSVTSLPATLTVQEFPASLISWWRAEGDALDSVGTNLGTLQGAVSFTNGLFGQAFLCNGGYVSVPDAPSLRFMPGSSATFSVWAYRMSSALPFHIYGKRDGCSGGGVGINYQLGIDGSFPPTPAQQWVFWTLVHSGGKTLVYTNGVFAQQWADFGPTNSAPFEIGRSGTCEYFYGLVDDLRVYNQAIATNAIMPLYLAHFPTPMFLSQPTNRTVTAGMTASFRAVAAGTPPLAYQWQCNGTNLFNSARIAGAASDVLTITSTQTSDSSGYRLVVTNSGGSVTSVVTTLTVLLPPTIQTSDGSGGFSNGQFGFTLTGSAGQTVVVEGSTNLWNWIPLQTNSLGTLPWHFSDPTSSNRPARFYRGRVLP